MAINNEIFPRKILSQLVNELNIPIPILKKDYFDL